MHINVEEVPMGLMDDMKSKADNMMNDPKTREKVQKIADEKGITMEKAREHYMKMKKKDK